MAIVTAIYNVDFAAARIAKQNEWLIGKIHLHHGVADRHFVHDSLGFGNDDRVVLIALLLSILPRLQHVGRCGGLLAGRTPMPLTLRL